MNANKKSKVHPMVSKKCSECNQDDNCIYCLSAIKWIRNKKIVMGWIRRFIVDPAIPQVIGETIHDFMNNNVLFKDIDDGSWSTFTFNSSG